MKSKRAIKLRVRELNRLVDKFLDEKQYGLVQHLQDSVECLEWALATAKRRKRKEKR
jgi:hypothetical protein